MDPPFRSGPIFMKDAHSAESNEKSYFRFSSYGRFCTENSWKIANFECKNDHISKNRNRKLLKIDYSASFM